MSEGRLDSDCRTLDLYIRLLPFSISLLEQQSKDTASSQAHQRRFPLDRIVRARRKMVRHVELPVIASSLRRPEDTRLCAAQLQMDTTDLIVRHTFCV
jgi:hypothetical protein